MNWLKENKFLSILLVVTIVLAGLIAFVGIGAAGKANETAEAIESTKSNITRLESGKPYPSTENLNEKKENLQTVLTKASDARGLLLKYRPEEINNTTASAFTALFDKTEQDLQELYKSKGITLPEGWHMGFEKYKTAPVDEKNTGILSYEMKTLDWLFRTVADAGVSEVVSFYREPLPPEIGKEWNADAAAADAAPARGRPRPPQAQSAASAPVAKSLPFEIAVVGREQSLRKVLTNLSNSQDHFVVVRAIRVQNEILDAPNQKQVGFKDENATPGGGDVFGGGGFVFPTDDGAAEEPEAAETEDETADAEGSEEEAAPAAEEPVDSGRILQIVAGDEKLQYFIRGELLLFEDSATLPEVK